MAAGLIDKLHVYDGADGSTYVDRADLLALLRSDETVEACAIAVYRADSGYESWELEAEPTRQSYRDDVLAALRVLADEGAE